MSGNRDREMELPYRVNNTRRKHNYTTRRFRSLGKPAGGKSGREKRLRK
tara:strand:- start:127 stop:273 length:147 start_codon:yes stop_codon:yes gene_type:complete